MTVTLFLCFSQSIRHSQNSCWSSSLEYVETKGYQECAEKGKTVWPLNYIEELKPFKIRGIDGTALKVLQQFKEILEN